MHVLIIDNYDSFTYNRVHGIKATGLVKEVTVQRNHQVDPATIELVDAILCSPGPGIPSEAGDLLELIRYQVQSALSCALPSRRPRGRNNRNVCVWSVVARWIRFSNPYHLKQLMTSCSNSVQDIYGFLQF